MHVLEDGILETTQEAVGISKFDSRNFSKVIVSQFVLICVLDIPTTTMKFPNTCLTALLLLPSLDNLLANAELDGSSTCHSGPTIPGNFHGNDPAGTLAEGGYEVLVDDTVVSIDSTNVIASGTHKITIRQLSGTFIGMYAWANDAEALIASSEDTSTKGGVSWTAGGNNVSCNGSSGLTHVNMSDKTESSGILTMPSSSGSSVDVEFQMMTSFSSGSTFYYSRLTFEVEASNTKTPTASPTKAPTVSPTKGPTASPRKAPTASPTKSPTVSSLHAPTFSRSIAPTESLSRSDNPTKSPTDVPSGSFTSSPTRSPVFKQVTSLPSLIPTNPPSVFRSNAPTESPYQNDDMDDDDDDEDEDEESSFNSSFSSDSLDEDETSDDKYDDMDEEEENEGNYSDYSMSESSDQDEDSESIHDKDEIEVAIAERENMENESTTGSTREDVLGESDGVDDSFLRGSTDPSSTSFVNNAYGGAIILTVIMNIFAL